jgi:steroid 5-alpha reductase family enzyme
MTAPLALAGCLVALWLVSLRLRDASLIDLFWGPAFSVVSWPIVVSHGATPRSLLVTGLVSLWGLRLGAYLAWRNLGHGEDKRYAAMRERHGAAWWWRSLFVVFGLQGGLVWLVSWPVRAVASAAASPWGALDALGLALVLAGIALESIGDLQLARFKARPENRGRIMTSGLWSATRHPNYFGDFLTWWGFGAFALAVGAPAALVGPLAMSVLLVKVSGKDLLERGMAGRPGFQEYVETTSGFVPWWPRRPRR